MPPELPLWMHTHDTAATGVVSYMAAIHGGADGVDLSIRPLAAGTSQPDARALAHSLRGTGYALDIDVQKLAGIESMLEDALQEYEFNPTTTTPDARVLGFPMPGGAIGPNVHMMVKAGIIERYGEVLAEFPVVVKAGGAWTSVTPGSQQYWLQAFNNVLYGRWERIEAGYGRAVLGYFGRPPLEPDPDVVRRAAEQLGLEPFDGDPLAAAPVSIDDARAALDERGLPRTDENVFLVLASMVPGRKMETNEGIRLLTGKARIDLPLRKKTDDAAQPAPAAAAPTASATAAPAPAASGSPPAAPERAAQLTGPVTTRCTVEEGGRSRTFTVTLEPVRASGGGDAATAAAESPPAADSPPAAAAQPARGTPVHSTFAGTVDVVDVRVRQGERVAEGAVIAEVEAMKARHDIRTPVGGVVQAVHVAAGQEIDRSTPIVTIG
jgi:pyruvate carboxylase subunit B